MRLGDLTLALPQQLGDNLVDDLIGQCSHLVRRLGLNRVLDQNGLVLGHPQNRALRVGCFDKLSGGHIRGGNTLAFEIHDVVRTARNAAASITEGFDNCIAPLSQFGPQIVRSRAGHGWLHAAKHLTDPILLA